MSNLQLGRGHWTLGSRDGSTWSVVQAWTTHSLAEAASNPEFFQPLHGHVMRGTEIELWQIKPGYLDKPEAGVIAMLPLRVVEVLSDRAGPHVLVEPTGGILRLNPAPDEGLHMYWWRGAARVFRDGVEVYSAPTKLEAQEYLDEHTPKQARGQKPKAVQVDKQGPQNATPVLPHERCRPHDVTVAGYLKISRQIEVRTLLPIQTVLRSDQFFNMIGDVFEEGARVSITRYAADDYEEPIERLPLSIAGTDWPPSNVDNPNGRGRLKLFPKSSIEIMGQPETGFKLVQRDGMWTIRKDGKTAEWFKDKERAQWKLEELTGLKEREAA